MLSTTFVVLDEERLAWESLKSQYLRPYPDIMEKYDLDTPTSSSVREKIGFIRSGSGRISLKRRVTMFCQEAVANAYFWITVAIFTFIEPVLCGSYPTPAMLAVQFTVLSISTLLFLMQLVGVAANEWDKINAIEALVSFKSLRLPRRAHSLSLVKLWIFFTAEGEYFFEGIILGYAWATLPWRPGLAVLRCFRVFRLLWYDLHGTNDIERTYFYYIPQLQWCLVLFRDEISSFLSFMRYLSLFSQLTTHSFDYYHCRFYEVAVFRRFLQTTLGRLIGERFIHRALNVLKFSIGAIKALASEIFSLNEDTRGGLLLIMLFFYSAYVMGATMFIEGKGAFINCDNLGKYLSSSSISSFVFFYSSPSVRSVFLTELVFCALKKEGLLPVLI